jgi:hexosaminidase
MLRAIDIRDAPRFAFRSLHLDLGRNFQKKQTVLKLIDILASYKINHLLFYMTEDEGWRLEIPGLPELTQVGAFRKHVKNYREPALHPAYGSGPTPDSASHGSGYFTKADFIEILKYAHARHIQVIPELNFPGHARAAIKAMEARYQRLMKQGKTAEAEQFRLIDPNDSSRYYSAQGYKDNVVDVTRESVYAFYEKVMDELGGMYREAGLPFTKVHMGGDEVPDGAWEGSDPARKLFGENASWGTFKNLHGHFVRTIMPRLKKRGLEVHAWEEAALTYKKEGGNDVNKEFTNQLVPYIWNSIYDPTLAYRMANAGYKIVLCNVSNFYFDLAYNNAPKEPGLYWGGFVDTWDAFAFNPYDIYSTTYVDGMGNPMRFTNKVELLPEARKNIIGVEAQLWSETLKGEKMLEYYTLPKLFGYAQSAWGWNSSWQGPSDPAQRNKLMAVAWNVFANRMAASDLPRLSYMNGGYNYRVPPPGAVLISGQLKANSEMPGLQIRFTTDGTDPDLNSELYKGPVKVRGKIRLRCFDAAGKSSEVIEL